MKREEMGGGESLEGEEGGLWVDRQASKVLDSPGVSNSEQLDSGQTCHAHTHSQSNCQ